MTENASKPVVCPLIGSGSAPSDPAASTWQSVAPVRLALVGTPIGLQPTSYMKSSWKDREIGAVEWVDVRTCHDGESIYLRLEWLDRSENRSTGDGTTFIDAAAVAFPLAADAPINTMGNEQAGVNAWQWRASSGYGFSVVAHGLGTTEPTDEQVDTESRRDDGRWQVVIARRLAGVPVAAGATVSLSPGATTRFGVAVWEGSNGERAGFKAFTEQWVAMELAPA